jgi:hypothetical protein
MPIVNSNNQQTTLSGNWNNPTGNYTGFRIQVTDTSSTGNSKPFAIDVNGVTKFAVGKDGTVYTTGTFSGSFVSGNTGQFTSVTASNYVGITTGHVNSLTEAIQDITAAELSGRSGIGVVYDDANGITYISGIAATTTTPGVIKYSSSYLTTNAAGQLDIIPSNLNTAIVLQSLGDVGAPGGIAVNMAPVYSTNDTFDLTYIVNRIYVSGTTAVTAGPSGHVNLQGAGSVSVIARTADNTIIITGSAGGSTTVPGGANTQVQFNDNGTFSGLPSFTFDKATQTLTVTNIYATNYSNLNASIVPNYYGVITAMAKGLISP